MGSQEKEYIHEPPTAKPVDPRYINIFKLCRGLKIIPHAMTERQKMDYIAEFFLMRYYYVFLNPADNDPSMKSQLTKIFNLVKQAINFEDFKLLMQSGVENSQRSYATEEVLYKFLTYYRGLR